MIKKGDVFYAAWLSLETMQSEKCSIQIEEWIVTSSNKNGVYLTQKIERVTWGKKSTRNGDYRFLDNIDPLFKKHIKNPNDLKSEGLFKTKISAFRSIKPILDRKFKELQRLVNRVNKEISKTK